MRESDRRLRLGASHARSFDLLKPILRAYLFGHLSTTGPRLLAILFSLSTKWRHYPHTLSKVWAVLLHSLSVNRFPYFCAMLVGSYEILQLPLLAALEVLCLRLLRTGLKVGPSFRIRTSRYLAAFAAAWFTIPLLNRAAGAEGHARDQGISSRSSDRAGSPAPDGNRKASHLGPSASLHLAGRTMDLTLLAVVRALESLTRQTHLSLLRSSAPSSASPTSSLLRPHIGPLADAAVFAASAAIIMWAWIYAPERLPRSYSRWIGTAAQIDPRLIEVLRAARRGDWVYGTSDPAPREQEQILASMCTEYSWPSSWADPAKTCPLPCEVVHMGSGPSCHWHAAVRFGRAFRFSLAMYLPLQLAVKMRRMPGASASRRLALLLTAAREAGRSSAFLGAFIALYYYSVCLARTQLGPWLLSGRAGGTGHGHRAKGTGSRVAAANRVSDAVFVRSQQMLDSGLCIGSGCIACGWSILVEAPRRRQELAYFAAPRAVATVLPRRYPRQYFWREQLAFALSTGVLFTLAHEDAGSVRGVLGQLVHGVLS